MTTWPADATLRLEAVHARRGPTEILGGVDLAVGPGERLCVVGRSGSGKSTLLRLLNRLADPSSGRITLGGVPTRDLPVTRLRRDVGLVFQAPRPLPGTVRDALAFPYILSKTRPPADPAEALREVGLDPAWIDRETSALSGGERQRLALAVALGTNPRILALDEPTSALDPEAARLVADALRLRSESSGLTTIAVTHARDQTPLLGTRTVVLDGGRVVDDGPTAEVLARVDARAWDRGASS